MKSFIVGLLFIASAQAQNISIIGGFGGLNDTDSSITIGAGEAQSTLNVETSLDGLALKKRKGYASYANLTIATGPVRGSAYFKTTSGSNIKLFAHDVFVSKSVDGGAFTNIITSSPVGAKWSFCVSNGKAYAFSNSTFSFVPWSYDGTSLTYYPGMPKASLCAMTVDRMLLAGTTDQPNRLYFSESGNITNFTVDTDPEDPGFEDIGLPGEKITALFATQSEWLIFKANSFTSYQGTNQFDLSPSVISEKIGITDPRAIVQHEGAIYFKSSTGKIYGYAAGTLTEISKKISGIVSGITKDSVFSSEYTTKDQFDTGTYSASTGNITAGSVEPYDYGFTHTLDSDFASGSVSNSTVIVRDDAVVFNYQTATFPNMGFETGTTDYWTLQYSSTSYRSASPTYGVYALEDVINTVGAQAFKAEAWISSFPITDSNYALYKSSCSLYAGFSKSVDLSTQPFELYYLTFNCAGNTGFSFHRYIQSPAFTKGTITYYIAGNLYDEGKTCYYDVSQPTIIKTSGTFTSAVSTITAPVPHKGQVVFTSSTPAGSGTSFAVRSATAVAGPFTGWTTLTSPAILPGTTNQYWQYMFSSTNTTSFLTPTLTDVQLIFKSTGYYETPETQNNGMNAWGTFLADTNLTGTGAWTYGLYVSTFSDGTATATPTTITSGATIVASTGTYSKVRATNSFTASTETVRLNSLSYSWSLSPDNMVNAFEYKGNIYFGVPWNTSFTNNRLLKYLPVTGDWHIFDVPVNSPLSIDEYVYFGSPTGGYIYQYPSGDNDNNAAINSYWKSKNFIGTNPYVEKRFDKISAIVGSDYGSSLDMTYTIDTATSTTYTIDLTSTTANFIRNNRQLPMENIGSFFNLQVGNNSANTPWSFYGATIDYIDDPWRVIP